MHGFSDVAAMVGSTLEFAMDVRLVVDDRNVRSALAGRCALVARWVVIAVAAGVVRGQTVANRSRYVSCAVSCMDVLDGWFILRQERAGS